ncbi:MAG: arginase family protein, partial [Pyrinomonadaceae bacterium]
TPYRLLLEEKLLVPSNFYEIAWQPHANSKFYYEYLKKLGVKTVSLEEFQSSDFKFQIKEILSNLNSQFSTFWGFDVDSVRASDAPGTSAPSPIGLTSEDFVTLSKIAGEYEQTRLIEFTEANPNYDIDNRTAKLVAIAMYYSIQK